MAPGLNASLMRFRLMCWDVKSQQAQGWGCGRRTARAPRVVTHMNELWCLRTEVMTSCVY